MIENILKDSLGIRVQSYALLFDLAEFGRLHLVKREIHVFKITSSLS